MSAGLAYTFVRKAGAGGASRNLIVFFFSVFSCIVILPFMVVGFVPMKWYQTLYLLAAGAAAAGGQVFITQAYTYAPAKEISVFDYTIVIFTAAFGAAFLREFPDALSYAGYAVVILGAGISWLYHMVKERSTKAAEAVSGGADKTPARNGSASDGRVKDKDPPGGADGGGDG